MSPIYDVSVPLGAGGLVYPGNPAISITPAQAIARGDSSNVSSLAFGSHTGTHVDAPRHMLEGAETVDHLPLDVLMGPARVLAFADDVGAIGRAELDAQMDRTDGSLGGMVRVLLKTRNSAILTQDPTFHPDYTYLAPDGAEWLAERGVRLVGIDYLSIEQFHSGHHATHRTLLARGIVIVEGLALADVPAGDYDFRCLPLRIVDGDGAPARAVLIGPSEGRA